VKLTITNENSVSVLAALLLVCAFSSSGNLFATGSAVEGLVKDANGRPVGGADIRIEARTGNSSRLVKTDARGHYVYDGLTPGATYRVTLSINGAAKASINNILAKGGSTELNFDLKTKSVSANGVVTKKGKHYVYIPAETGSHLGGRWVEVDDNGQADSVSVNNVERANSEALRRMQSNSGAVGGMTGSGR
jgi:Carboxypeptidase regulatory-like domain